MAFGDMASLFDGGPGGEEAEAKGETPGQTGDVHVILSDGLVLEARGQKSDHGEVIEGTTARQWSARCCILQAGDEAGPNLYVQGFGLLGEAKLGGWSSGVLVAL